MKIIYYNLYQKNNPVLSYANHCINKFIFCSIVETLSIEVQETVLSAMMKMLL